MPQAMEYIPPTSPLRSALQEFVSTRQERDTREREYKKARDYYLGQQKKQLVPIEDEPDDNIIINLVQQSVDRATTFLFPSMPDFELDPDVSATTPDELWLKDAWMANGGIALLHEMYQSGALSGDVYIRMLPPDLNSEMGDFPQIVLLDPATVITFWRADDYRKVVWHEIRWSLNFTIGNNTVTQMYILDFVYQPDGKWKLFQYKNGSGSGISGMVQSGANIGQSEALSLPSTTTTNNVGTWQLDKTEDWGYPYSPIVHWKHNNLQGSYYGLADITEQQRDLNDSYNLVESENSRIIRYHAAPKTIVTGADGSDVVGTDLNTLWSINKPDAKVFNLEMKGDLVASHTHAQGLRDAFLAQTRTVILQGAVKDFQRVTNAGVRTVFLDMLSKNIVLRWNYGRGLQEISKRLLMLGNKSVKQPDISQSDPLPVDDAERISVLSQEQKMGIVSHETLAYKRGYNWDAELVKKEAEMNNPILNPVQNNPNDPNNPNNPNNSGNGANNTPADNTQQN